jgi:DNA-binding beta-propeller fold protein YncE
LEGKQMLDVKVNAPELEGGVGWLNTDKPIKIKDLKGKVVLLDFWTFCCINCMHVIPDLKRLEHKYPRELVVIGVHSAKFDNEKDSKNIREAILRYGLEHPVVNDAQFKIWQAYGAKAWPTLILIDTEGHIVGAVSGEGHYNVLDEQIQALIKDAEKQGKLDRRPLNFALEKNKVLKTPLSFPGKVASDADGHRLFISDSGHNRIIVATTEGKVTEVIGMGEQGATNGSFDRASFNHPQGLAYDDDKLYVADTGNHLIRLIDLRSRTVSTIAGTGHQADFGAKGGDAVTAALSSPWDLLLLGDKLYVAMAGAHQIWLLDLTHKTIAPYAGNGREDIVDGALHAASLAQPSGLTTDGNKLYFADSEVSAVRSAELTDGGAVATLIGDGLFTFGDKDGIGCGALLQHPLGIAWHDGKLYVADSYNHKIKEVDPLSHSAKSLFGTGKAGYADGASAKFSEPGGLAFIGRKMYIADTNNSEIRIADLNSHEVSTFKINNLSAPSIVSTPKPSASATSFAALPNLQKVSIALTEVPPETKGAINLKFTLPKGFHLNAETSTKYRVEQKNGDAIHIDAARLEGALKPPTLQFSVPFKSGEAGLSSVIKLTVTLYYCTESERSICTLKNIEIDAPVRVSETSRDASVAINCTVTE